MIPARGLAEMALVGDEYLAVALVASPGGLRLWMDRAPSYSPLPVAAWGLCTVPHALAVMPGARAPATPSDWRVAISDSQMGVNAADEPQLPAYAPARPLAPC